MTIGGRSECLVCSQIGRSLVSRMEVLTATLQHNLVHQAAADIGSRSMTLEDQLSREVSVARPSKGWRIATYRTAAVLITLAAVGGGYQGWSMAFPSADAIAFYPKSVAVAFGLGALLLLTSGILAWKEQRRCIALLVLGYLVPAVTLYVAQESLIPPSLLLGCAAFAMLVAAWDSPWQQRKA